MGRTHQTAKKSTGGKHPGRPDLMTRAARVKLNRELNRQDRIRINNEIGRQKL